MNLEVSRNTTDDAWTGQPFPQQEWRTSRDGQSFDVYAERWQLNSRRSVNISTIRQLLPPALQEGAIRALVHSAETLSSKTLVGRVSSLRVFLQSAGANIGSTTVSIASVANYRHLRQERDGHDAEFSRQIRPLLKLWFELGYPGVTQELIDEIKTWRLKNGESGAAVNSLHPDHGPLTPGELSSLQLLALTAFEQGALSLEDFSLLRLMTATGRRPLQAAQIKVGDFDDSKWEEPEPGQEVRRLLLLKVPRVKMRGAPWRTRFRAVPLTADLWNLLVMQQHSVCKRFDELLDRIQLVLAPDALMALHAELPLIPMWPAIETSFEALQSIAHVEGEPSRTSVLLRTASSDTWHRDSTAIHKAFGRIVDSVNATNRDGNQLKVFPRRLRYTYQSRLEQAGCSPAVIAWNMDHSSIQSQISYSKNGPDKARAISKAMAVGLASFVKVFQGKVVANEESAEGGQNPAASRILVDGRGGATCATSRGCGMNALPRPCYAGCPHFRPWVDGPHEQFLATILDERQRDLDAGISKEVIEANDQLILGVAQVIQLCEQQRKASSEEAPRRARKPRREK